MLLYYFFIDINSLKYCFFDYNNNKCFENDYDDFFSFNNNSLFCSLNFSLNSTINIDIVEELNYELCLNNITDNLKLILNGKNSKSSIYFNHIINKSIKIEINELNISFNKEINHEIDLNFNEIILRKVFFNSNLIKNLNSDIIISDIYSIFNFNFIKDYNDLILSFENYTLPINMKNLFLGDGNFIIKDIQNNSQILQFGSGYHFYLPNSNEYFYQFYFDQRISNIRIIHSINNSIIKLGSLWTSSIDIGPRIEFFCYNFPIIEFLFCFWSQDFIFGEFYLYSNIIFNLYSKDIPIKIYSNNYNIYLNIKNKETGFKGTFDLVNSNLYINSDIESNISFDILNYDSDYKVYSFNSLINIFINNLKISSLVVNFEGEGNYYLPSKITGINSILNYNKLILKKNENTILSIYQNDILNKIYNNNLIFENNNYLIYLKILNILNLIDFTNNFISIICSKNNFLNNNNYITLNWDYYQSSIRGLMDGSLLFNSSLEIINNSYCFGFQKIKNFYDYSNNFCFGNNSNNLCPENSIIINNSLNNWHLNIQNNIKKLNLFINQENILLNLPKFNNLINLSIISLNFSNVTLLNTDLLKIQNLSIESIYLDFKNDWINNTNFYHLNLKNSILSNKFFPDKLLYNLIITFDSTSKFLFLNNNIFYGSTVEFINNGQLINITNEGILINNYYFIVFQFIIICNYKNLILYSSLSLNLNSPSVFIKDLSNNLTLLGNWGINYNIIISNINSKSNIFCNFSQIPLIFTLVENPITIYSNNSYLFFSGYQNLDSEIEFIIPNNTKIVFNQLKLGSNSIFISNSIFKISTTELFLDSAISEIQNIHISKTLYLTKPGSFAYLNFIQNTSITYNVNYIITKPSRINFYNNLVPPLLIRYIFKGEISNNYSKLFLNYINSFSIGIKTICSMNLNCSSWSIALSSTDPFFTVSSKNIRAACLNSEIPNQKCVYLLPNINSPKPLPIFINEKLLINIILSIIIFIFLIGIFLFYLKFKLTKMSFNKII